MQKEVIFRPRQNITYSDLNNLQDYARQSLDDLTSDMLVTGQGYAGFTVTKASSTTISVEPGRLYDSGKAYILEDAETISLASYLPAVAKKVLTLVAYGQALETDVEPRDFLINVTTRATEPQSVAMTSLRKAVLSPIQGLESADPLAPAIPAGYVPIATIYLSTAGIDLVEMRIDTKVPELDALSTALSSIYTWQNTAGKIIEGLRSDLANLARRAEGSATQSDISAIMSDIAVLKDINDLPDSSAKYGADNFMDEGESDTAHGSYDAEIVEGVRFANAASVVAALAVDNPYNGLVDVVSGTMIPKYTAVDGLVVGSLDKNVIVQELPLADYQYQTYNMVEKEMSRTRIRYGDYFSVSVGSQFWRSGKYDPVKGIFTRNGETFAVEGTVTLPAGWNAKWWWWDWLLKKYTWPITNVRLRRVWEDSYDEPYWVAEQTTSSVQGSQIAQSFLNTQPRYCVGISLAFTKIGPTGSVNVALVECREDGTPDLSNTLTQVTLTQGQLKLFPTAWTYAQFQPTFMKQGGRYAVVVTTGGAHFLGAVAGTNFTNGTIFFGTDGAYMLGDITKDLAFKVHHAQFTRPSITVDLTALQLAGGISNLDFLAPMVVPEPATITFQVRISGIWYNLDANSVNSVLSSLPTVLPLRVILNGTSDIMPIVNLTNSQIIASRPKTALTHISTTRTLPVGFTSADIKVRLTYSNWDAANHTIAVKLRHGAGYTTVRVADSTTTEIAVVGRNAEDKVYTKEWTFTPSAIGSYKIQIEGTTTSAANTFHIERRVDIAS